MILTVRNKISDKNLIDVEIVPMRGEISYSKVYVSIAEYQNKMEDLFLRDSRTDFVHTIIDIQENLNNIIYNNYKHKYKEAINMVRCYLMEFCRVYDYKLVEN